MSSWAAGLSPAAGLEGQAGSEGEKLHLGLPGCATVGGGMGAERALGKYGGSAPGDSVGHSPPE